ncbi:MAG: site-specific integrase [Armatimonadota bacterium]
MRTIKDTGNGMDDEFGGTLNQKEDNPGDAASPLIVYTPHSAGSLTTLSNLGEEAREHVENSKASNTRRAYASDWADFTQWCRHHGLPSLPATPETVGLYLTDCAKGLKTSTLQRRLATISQAHQAAGHDSPTKHAAVRAVWQGIKRTKGTVMVGKTPTLIADLRVMVEHLPGREEGKILAVRDRALLLLGFAGAMRRSELVGLDVEDVVETGDGLIVTIRRSKTDQEGAGRKIGLPYGSSPLTCPVRALRDWRAVGQIADGPLFRQVNRHNQVGRERLSDQMVARVVKRALVAAGRDTRCGRGLPPRRPSAARRNDPYRTRPGTRACPSFAATSATGPCSERTPPQKSDCNACYGLVRVASS